MESGNAAAEEEEKDDAELFSENYMEGYVKNLLRIQGNPIKLPETDEHYDLYLGRELYPVLLPGIELLSREILRFTEQTESIDPSIRQRFNPCIFLAEYLMRNNPNKGAKVENAELFESLAKVERVRRFFKFKRQKIFKHFTLQPYHSNFCKKDVNEYVKALDFFLMMDKKLVNAFRPDEIWADTEPSEQVGFDNFYDEIEKWAVQQTELQYEDFAAAEI